MKFHITVEGGHQAEVNVELDGKGGFTGNIISPEFGTGEITSGVQAAAGLSGTVSLGGHSATVTAIILGNTITGRLKAGWFFSRTFTGTLAA